MVKFSICIGSIHQLMLDVLQTTIQHYRPTWKVDTFLITPGELESIVLQLQYKALLIDISYENFGHLTPFLAKLQSLNVPIVFITNENIGEIFYHTQNIDHWVVQTRNVSIEKLLSYIEKKQPSQSIIQNKQKLTSFETTILENLAKGHSIEYIYKMFNVPQKNIHEAIQAVNNFYGTSHYLQAVYKAYHQKT